MSISLSTIPDYLKDHWKMLVVGIFIGFALIAIIFALPLVTITSSTTETEYVTEVRQESYVVNEPYVTTEMVEKARVVASGFYKVLPGGVVVPFIVDKPGSILVGQFDNTIPGSFNVLTDNNRIIWEMLGSRGTINLSLPPGEYQARFRENIMWGEDCFIYLAIKWTNTEQITRYQQVTKYREVPIKVEKQKTTVKAERVSVWKYLFMPKQS